MTTINQDMIQVGSLTDTLFLYSEQCPVLLRQALELEESTKANDNTNDRRRRLSAVNSDSESDQEDEEDAANSSSGSETEDDPKSQLSADAAISVEAPIENPNPSSNSNTNKNAKPKPTSTKKVVKPTQTEQQLQHAVRKSVENLVCDAMPMNDSEAILISTSLLSKASSSDIADRNYVPPSLCQEYLTLSESLQSNKKHVMVILLRSGRFAAGIFQGSKCVVHRACQRYTVRKGQGKAQSTQDGNRRPKSMGAQLRRAGEENLQQDIQETLQDWKPHIEKCTIILLSCPKAMKKYLFEAMEEANVGISDKADKRLRRLPLDIGRPSFENVCLAHQVMMTVQIRQWTPKPTLAETIAAEVPNKPSKTQQAPQQAPKKEEPTIIFPLTPLHTACQKGDVAKITELLADKQQTFTDEDETLLTVEQMINRRVGPDFMTCLHYAAESSAVRQPTEQSTSVAAAAAAAAGQGEEKSDAAIPVEPEIAADCVSQLLLDGKADPSIEDARCRPPYFLSAHDKVRDAFRLARATLGEDYCKWDNKAKVGPPLTVDDIQAKKEKEAEKKRKKKARQKQKKAQEKAEAEQDQRQRDEAEGARKKEEDAKRVRDGLQPKVAGGNACDFCQVVVKGRKRKDMFSRLEYVYCSAECVQKHKRELMAAAALSRFGGA